VPLQRRQKLYSGLNTSLLRVNGSVFVGHVVDPADPYRRFSVELLIDGLVVQTAFADRFSTTIAPSIGDGCCGFVIPVATSLLESGGLAEARVANLGDPIGAPIDLADPTVPASAAVTASRLRWLGGLRFRGWIAEAEPLTALKVVVNGENVMELDNLPWAQADDEAYLDQPVRGIDFHLPGRFADGCVKMLSVVKGNGEALAGLPLPFVAFPDGLAATIAGFGTLESERLRGELYDRLIPCSLPFSSYREWKERFPIVPIAAGDFPDLRAGVLVIGSEQLQLTVESLERQSLPHWTAGAIGGARDASAFDAADAKGFLDEEAADCDFIVFALAGTEFAPNALQRIAACFAAHKQVDIVYGDLEVTASDGSLWPLAFPAFDYERLLEQGYCALVFALRRRTAARQLAGSPSNLFRLFNSIFDDSAALQHESVAHLPGAIAVLPSLNRDTAGATLRDATAAHLKARRMEAAVTIAPSALLPAAQVRRTPPHGRTTIIIPTRNRVELLADCLDSLQPVLARSDVDLLVVDNDSSDDTTIRFLSELKEMRGTRVLPVPGPFNYARLNNLAALETGSDFLLFLNNDVKALDGNWLDEMHGRMAEPDVGAVGALLAWPSGMVQHGGVVLGPRLAAAHAFSGRTTVDPGYADLLRVAHECSAVTAACMLTRRDDFLSLGGMDDIHFPVSFNDVDYCLRLRAASRRIIMTPHARLVHLEYAGHGGRTPADHSARFARELTALRHRWGEILLADPFYNPTLSLDPIPFSALAWPARSLDMRLQVPIKAKDVPAGF
jgi:GT2 family glycosyltransferase